MEDITPHSHPSRDESKTAEDDPAPKPKRFLFGRPVYSEDELRKMDPFLPPEPEWAAELARRKAKKKAR